MTTQWGRFEQSAGRTFDQLSLPDVKIYNFSESYDSDTGGSTWTESEASNSPVQMEVGGGGGGDIMTDAGGQAAEEETQFIATVDDVGIGYGFSWGQTYGESIIVAAGQDDSRPTELEVVPTSQRYVVSETTWQGDGTLRITGIEK